MPLTDYEIKAAHERAARQQVIDDMELTMTTTFIPWDKSRRAEEKMPSLNWQVTLLIVGKMVITTDYSAGYGHCPSQKGKSGYNRMTIEERGLLDYECANGKEARWWATIDHAGSRYPGNVKRGLILPDMHDVVHALLSDSEALEYRTFEEWAHMMGYNSDSRKDEAIYKACLDIGLWLRNGLGEKNLAKLREAFQGY